MLSRGAIFLLKIDAGIFSEDSFSFWISIIFRSPESISEESSSLFF
jgi:hypothetical protein